MSITIIPYTPYHCISQNKFPLISKCFFRARSIQNLALLLHLVKQNIPKTRFQSMGYYAVCGRSRLINSRYIIHSAKWHLPRRSSHHLNAADKGKEDRVECSLEQTEKSVTKDQTEFWKYLGLRWGTSACLNISSALTMPPKSIW